MSWGLNVCTYNVMLTVPAPLRFNGQKTRAKHLPDSLHDLDQEVPGGLDVIVFEELMAPGSRNSVLRELKKLGWDHVSEKLSAGVFSDNSYIKVMAGGVVVASKHPIIYQKNHVFRDTGEGYDALACKGAVFCRIMKERNVFNLLATHLQAWDTPECVDIRRTQAKMCTELVESLALPEDEPLIFAGDFNVDTGSKVEFDELLSTLSATRVGGEGGLEDFTSDPMTNALVGNDDMKMYSTEKYPRGCYTEYMDTLSCPCCPRRIVDHVLFSTKHLRPSAGKTNVHALKSREDMKVRMRLGTKRTHRDLSDHYPVVGSFSFSAPTPFGARTITSTLPPDTTLSKKWRTVITASTFALIVAMSILWIIIWQLSGLQKFRHVRK